MLPKFEAPPASQQWSEGQVTRSSEKASAIFCASRQWRYQSWAVCAVGHGRQGRKPSLLENSQTKKTSNALNISQLVVSLRCLHQFTEIGPDSATIGNAMAQDDCFFLTTGSRYGPPIFVNGKLSPFGHTIRLISEKMTWYSSSTN